MTRTQTERQLLPLYRVIVTILRSWSLEQTSRLLYLIPELRFDQGYDETITAIDESFDFPGGGKWARAIREAKEHLLEQKRLAGEAKVDLAASFHFDGKERALMVVIEKIIGIVREVPCSAREANDLDQVFKLFEAAKLLYHASNEAEFKLAVAEL